MRLVRERVRAGDSSARLWMPLSLAFSLSLSLSLIRPVATLLLVNFKYLSYSSCGLALSRLSPPLNLSHPETILVLRLNRDFPRHDRPIQRTRATRMVSPTVESISEVINSLAVRIT